MAYKDKHLQREANRQASQRRRDKLKGMTPVPDSGMTGTSNVIPSEDVTEPEVTNITRPANFGQSDCQCRHCQNNRNNGSRLTINHGPYKRSHELVQGEVNRISLPGDVDYREAG